MNNFSIQFSLNYSDLRKNELPNLDLEFHKIYLQFISVKNWMNVKYGYSLLAGILILGGFGFSQEAWGFAYIFSGETDIL